MRKKKVVSNAGSAFDQYVAGQTRDTASKAEFDRHLAKVKTTAAVLQAFDDARASRGLTKAQVAHALRTDAAVVSRLFGHSPNANPTLGTIVDLADVLRLDVRIEIKSRRSSRRKASPIEVYSTL